MGRRNPGTASTRRRSAILAGGAALLVVGLVLVWLLAGGPGAGGDGPYTDVRSVRDVHGLAVHPDDSAWLYLATHSGLHRMSSDGAVLQRIGDREHDHMGFTVNPRDGREVWVSGHPGLKGVERSRDGGVTWETLALRGEVDFHAMTVANADPRTLHAWYYGDRLWYRSDDGGRTWESSVVAVPSVLALATPHGTPDVVLAATMQGLQRSTDGGRTFAPVPGAEVARWHAAAYDPQDDRVAYAFSSAQGLVRGTWGDDGDARWETLPLAAPDVGHLAVDPRDPDVLYAGTYEAQVWKSTDRGATWAKVR